jgi:L-alanine-DL-glutamate epimerase-like enolase superfamily enzyme
MDTVPETFPESPVAVPTETESSSPAAPVGGPLTIESIEVTPIIVPLDREYRGSYYRMTNRATVLTRVTTSEGIIGEAYAGDEDATLAEIVAVVTDELTPRLIGQDAFAIERCWELGFPVTYDLLRDRRIGLVALASVDLALWDAIGKALNRPLWQLWGGYRSSLAVNLIGGYYGPDLAGIREEVAEWRELGFRGCKFKVGGKTPAEDAERVQAAREAGGDDFVLTIDANQGYTRAQAIDLCRRVRDLDIRWFEEPCVWSNDARDMRDVRATGGIPVCAGQSEHSPEGCRDLMELGAIDVCNFDASWSGGPTEWRRVAGMALTFDVAMAHHEEPQVAAHLLASQPHGTYLEVFHPDRDPIWWRMIANRPELVDGVLQVPTGPGLGWELDLDFVERYRVSV